MRVYLCALCMNDFAIVWRWKESPPSVLPELVPRWVTSPLSRLISHTHSHWRNSSSTLLSYLRRSDHKSVEHVYWTVSGSMTKTPAPVDRESRWKIWQEQITEISTCLLCGRFHLSSECLPKNNRRSHQKHFPNFFFFPSSLWIIWNWDTIYPWWASAPCKCFCCCNISVAWECIY